jgi:hypothetical protein
MKNYILILGAIALISITSCRKEVVYPTDQLPSSTPTASGPSVGNWGKFVITDAVMYVIYENGGDTVYQHFSSTKSRSSLRWGGSLFAIENIIKDTTTYSFWKPAFYPGLGKFVLNGDTTQHYDVQYTGLNRRIVEDPTSGQQLMGGSARPFSGQTISYGGQTIAIEIGEMQGSINGVNCSYYTRLTLKKIQTW